MRDDEKQSEFYIRWTENTVDPKDVKNVVVTILDDPDGEKWKDVHQFYEERICESFRVPQEGDVPKSKVRKYDEQQLLKELEKAARASKRRPLGEIVCKGKVVALMPGNMVPLADDFFPVVEDGNVEVYRVTGGGAVEIKKGSRTVGVKVVMEAEYVGKQRRKRVREQDV